MSDADQNWGRNNPQRGDQGARNAHTPEQNGRKVEDGGSEKHDHAERHFDDTHAHVASQDEKARFMSGDNDDRYLQTNSPRAVRGS